METTNLGAVGISAGGVYNPETVYKKYKVVSANGGSYMYINSTPAAGVPLTDTSHWQQIASRGMTGPSAYDAAVAGGYAGTEVDFNAANAGIEAAKDAALDAAQTANEASEIALAISTADTWERVAYFVRLGKGPQVFPVGSVLRAAHTTYGDILWRVMAHNHDVNKNAPELPTMRIEMIACIYGRAVAAPGLLWANTGAAELPAGTYNFTLYKADNAGDIREDGTYQFTTAQAIPVGGGFRHSQIGVYRTSSGLYVPANIIGNHLTTYDASGVAIESNLAVTAGSGGTSLGTASRNWADTVNTIGQFNSTQRNAYGSNHAGESAVRQWINSPLGANLWFTKKTPFDLKPTYANQPGFLAGFDADFLDALVTVDNVCARNTVYEVGGTLGGSYVMTDKMFLPSMTELGLGVNNAIAEGAVLDYYEGTTALERIKFDITSPATARHWFLRSPHPSHAYNVRSITPDGALNDYGANNGNGVALDCVIG